MAERKIMNKSVKKALRVLDLFNDHNPDLSMKEIADRMGTAPGTISPIVSSIEEMGYLVRNRLTKRYSLGLEFLCKSALVLRRIEIRNVAEPFIEELQKTSGETTHMGIMDDGQVLYIAKKEVSSGLMIRSYIGKRVPAHCTAMGKVLLASLGEEGIDAYLVSAELSRVTENTITDKDQLRNALRETRVRGYAVDEEEYQIGGMCVAAGVWDFRGKMVAAISVALPASTATGEKLASMVKHVKNTAAKISKSLGFKRVDMPTVSAD